MLFSRAETGKTKRLKASIFILIGCAGTLAAQLLWASLQPCRGNYDLVSPSRRCGTASEQGEWDYEPLRDLLLERRKALTDEGKITNMSIYFRDLSHGPRFGIGEYDKFQPASLIKLPVLIAFLHEADRDPTILDKQLSYAEGELSVSENVDEAWETIKPDTSYTIRELLEKMIVYSDNYSYALLTKEMNSRPSITTYYTFRDLNILRMMQAPNADFISIQSYSNLFAVLYTTGYLSRDMSQFALELLTKSTFKEGLVAGVPQRIRIAHKFGHRVLADADSQLHDCGIVYHPTMDYILCIMTTGTTLEGEEDAIADISKNVYNTISTIHYDDDHR